MLKSTLQILFVVAVVAQLSGCFFVDRDHRDRHDYREHHEDHYHDAGVDVHLHG